MLHLRRSTYPGNVSQSTALIRVVDNADTQVLADQQNSWHGIDGLAPVHLRRGKQAGAKTSACKNGKTTSDNILCGDAISLRIISAYRSIPWFLRKRSIAAKQRTYSAGLNPPCIPPGMVMSTLSTPEASSAFFNLTACW